MTTRKLNLKNEVFWAIAMFVILINALFLFVSMSEIYTVSFIETGIEYPWGAEPFPWYYESKTTYLTFIASWSILFLAIFLFQVHFAFRVNKTKELYSGLAFVFAFVAMYVSQGEMN